MNGIPPCTRGARGVVSLYVADIFAITCAQMGADICEVLEHFFVCSEWCYGMVCNACFLAMRADNRFRMAEVGTRHVWPKVMFNLVVKAAIHEV